MRDDIRKRREKYNIETPAMKIFGGDKKLVVQREPGMSKQQLKYLRKLQQKALKMIFRKSPDRRIAALMRPAIPSEHLQLQVARHRAIKRGYLEEVRPEKTAIAKNIFTRLLNFFRSE